MLKIFKSGRHSQRTPLSYPSLWPLFQDSITLVDRPNLADLYVFAHVLDIQDAPIEMIEDWRVRQRPVVLLSEEPFWDTIWCRYPLDPLIYVETSWGTLPVQQLNHCTCDIYKFKRIPYYLLTNHRFANAYSYRFERNAALSTREWQEDFSQRTVDLTYMFERRTERYHWVEWPEADLTGLCSWRTDLAETYVEGVVEHLGKSWRSDVKSRFELSTDWHMDKLTRLDGRARMIGAIENTYHPNYITEKLFDAFACGAMPIYWAGGSHRIRELGLPEESWVNLCGMTPTEGAASLQQAIARLDFEAFREANSRLKMLFSDPKNWVAERHRLRASVLSELERLNSISCPW